MTPFAVFQPVVGVMLAVSAFLAPGPPPGPVASYIPSRRLPDAVTTWKERLWTVAVCERVARWATSLLPLLPSVTLKILVSPMVMVETGVVVAVEVVQAEEAEVVVEQAEGGRREAEERYSSVSVA